MKTYDDLWEYLCSWENLLAAYEQARKGKHANPCVQAFADHYAYQLALLRHELCTKTYRPKPGSAFVRRQYWGAKTAFRRLPLGKLPELYAAPGKPHDAEKL